MNAAIRPGPQPWKAALLALLFILVVGFGAAIALRSSGAVRRCRCHDMSPANKCFCPPLGNSCHCDR